MLRRSHWKQDYCPRCKGCIETTGHPLQCTHTECVDTFKKSTNELDLWLLRQQTPDIIREEIIHFLGLWKTQQPCNTNPKLSQPMQAQLQFGFEHFLAGRPVRDFELYMESYYKKHSIKKTGRKWLTVLIQNIWTVLHKPQWENRNAHVHNYNTESEASRATEELQFKLQQLYLGELQANLLVRNQHLMDEAM